MRNEIDVEKGFARDRCPSEGEGGLWGVALGRCEFEVDRASALVYEAVGRLSRDCPEHALGGAALRDLERMRPHFEGALEALAKIERCRGLTHNELSRRRAFKMLLEGARGR